MSREDRIDDLIDEILESHRAPEEVCAEHPDLLDEVRVRLRKLRSVQAQLDSLFPASAADARNTSPSSSGGSVAAWPAIPDYEIQSVLGRGGMGIVYRARHLKLNREVALKMLLVGSYASQQEHLRFVREAESVAALRHPHIVQIYDFGEANGHPYYTMEYVAGGSLAEKLAGNALSAREAAKIAAALALAVEAAHQAGILHRDLKPGNILIADEGHPKIADFGLARRLDQDSELTHTGARIGTPSYMAPEQMSGVSSQLSPAVDVFALGAMLYEMLTGRPPFRGETLSDTERKLATEEATAPSRLNPKVPRDLETICLKCLEKEPRSRYQSAGALAADLERFLRHEPIHARPVAPGERWLRWVRRNPLPTALVVSSVVLLGFVIGEALQQRSEARAARAEKTRLTARLQSGVQLVQSGRYSEARAILGELGDGGFSDLRQRIDRALADLDLIEKLEAIEIKRSMALIAQDPTWRPNAYATEQYEQVFAETRLGTMTDDPAKVANRVVQSDIKAALIAALDDWAVCESDESRRDWVLAVARQAGSGGTEWEDDCRDPATWSDRDALVRLTETAPLARPSVPLLRALGDRLQAAGIDPTQFRQRVQQDHVDSFLANLSLADALRATDPREAIRYYQAALAIRPESATAHNNLAFALAGLGRSTEAIDQFQQSIALDAISAAPQYNLGLELSKEHPDEAIVELRRALARKPALATIHRALGEAFLRQEQYAEAQAAFAAYLPLVNDAPEREKIEELIRACETKRAGASGE